MERPLKLLVPIGRVTTTWARLPEVVATVGDDLWLGQVCGGGDPGAWVGAVLTWTEHRVALLAQRFGPALYDKRLLGATRCSRYSLVFRLSVAGATAAPDTGVLPSASTRGQSTRPPSRACMAAIAWPSPSRWLEPAGAGAGAHSHGAGRSCSSRGTRPVAGPDPLRPCIGWRHVGRSPPHAVGW